MRFRDEIVGYRIDHPDGWFTDPARTYVDESSIYSFDIPEAPGTDPVPASELKVGVS